MPAWIHSDPTNDSYWKETGEQRPCARGERCAERGPGNTPALGPRAFCDTDRNIIGRALDWMPTAYTELYLRLPDKTVGVGGRVSGSRTPPVPPNLGVDALMVDIVRILGSWDERVRAVANLSELSLRMRDGVALTTMVRTLSAHLDVLLALPPEPMLRSVSIQQAAQLPPGTVGNVRPAAGYADVMLDLSGADAGLEILKLHGRARHMLGLTPRHQDLPVPCWACGLRTVRRWDGTAGLADEAECMECGEKYTAQRYDLLMAEVASMQRGKAS